MAVRARRHQRGWRLVDVAARAGVSRSLCGLLERGQAARLSVRSARAIASAVDLPLAWDIGRDRVDIDRLLDADHSALAAALARELTRHGWVVRSEVSFNHYGDRGRIDLLAYSSLRRVVLVVEIKTILVDAQELLGVLDVKTRLAPMIARELGWEADRVVPAIVLMDSTTARRRIGQLEGLLARFESRGHAARAWLADPAAPSTGLLVLSKLPSANGSDRRRAGRRRVRLGSRSSPDWRP